MCNGEWTWLKKTTQNWKTQKRQKFNSDMVTKSGPWNRAGSAGDRWQKVSSTRCVCLSLSGNPAKPFKGSKIGKTDPGWRASNCRWWFCCKKRSRLVKMSFIFLQKCKLRLNWQFEETSQREKSNAVLSGLPLSPAPKYVAQGLIGRAYYGSASTGLSYQIYFLQHLIDW